MVCSISWESHPINSLHSLQLLYHISLAVLVDWISVIDHILRIDMQEILPLSSNLGVPTPVVWPPILQLPMWQVWNFPVKNLVEKVTCVRKEKSQLPFAALSETYKALYRSRDGGSHILCTQTLMGKSISHTFIRSLSSAYCMPRGRSSEHYVHIITAFGETMWACELPLVS